MITYLSGKCQYKTTRQISLLIDRIAYGVYVANIDKFELNQEYNLYIYHHFSEHEQSLFGFFDLKEKALFESLISVKGIGPKTAINFFAIYSVDAILKAINDRDAKFLTKLPGIGKKGASQIILDLAGKIDDSTPSLISHGISIENIVVSNTLAALESLGYKSNELALISQKLVDSKIDSEQKMLKLALSLLRKE